MLPDPAQDPPQPTGTAQMRHAYRQRITARPATLKSMSSGISTRLVQLTHPEEGRRAALVYSNELHLLATYRSVYSFAMTALATGWRLREMLSTDLSGIVLDYDAVH